MASSVGESEEFVALREYRPGDPVAPDALEKLCQTGQAHRQGIPGRIFRPPRPDPGHFRRAGPARRFLRKRSRSPPRWLAPSRTRIRCLDLMFVGPEAYCFTSGRGVGHIEQMLEVLASVQVCREKEFRGAGASGLDSRGGIERLRLRFPGLGRAAPAPGQGLAVARVFRCGCWS